MATSRWLLASALLTFTVGTANSQQITQLPRPTDVEQSYPGSYSINTPPAPEPYDVVVQQLTRQALKTASALCKKGMYEQADYLLRKVQRLNPQDAEIRQALAAVQFVSGADHTVFGAENEPAPLPGICETPGSCASVPNPGISWPGGRLFEVFAGSNSTGPKAPDCAVRSGNTCADSVCRGCSECCTGPAIVSQTAPRQKPTSTCPNCPETVVCPDCPVTMACSAQGCAKDCCKTNTCPCSSQSVSKTSGQSVSPCSNCKNCECTKECCCGKGCSCNKNSVSTFLPPAGTTVIWVIPTSGIDTTRCPIMNKSVRMIHAVPGTQWIYQGSAVRTPTRIGPVVHPGIRPGHVPALTVSAICEEYERAISTNSNDRANSFATQNKRVVPFAEALPVSGIEECEAVGPVQIQYLPVSTGGTITAESLLRYSPYKVPTPRTQENKFLHIYSGTTR